MRLMRMIGLATLGYSAYRAYQSYSRSGGRLSPGIDTDLGSTTTRRSMMPLRRRGSI